MLPGKLYTKLELRKTKNAYRTLGDSNNLVDFSSNDYLGFSQSKRIFENANLHLTSVNRSINGSTGSRLLSGNHPLYKELEDQLKNIHQSEGSLVFNSGYAANIGLISTVPQRGDVILFDEFCHASIRDAISMSHAKAYKFKHNDLSELESLLNKFEQSSEEVYIITESVFSMDGDSPNLKALVHLGKGFKAHLIIDEAHTLGVFNYGMIQNLNLQSEVFARIVTFGKALGTHGAAVLGSVDLIDYLVNFSRPFIYTTALPPHTIGTILASYKELSSGEDLKTLSELIRFFKQEIKRLNLDSIFIDSDSAIQSAVLSGNDLVKDISKRLKSYGFDVKPILSPTVPQNKERLRFCLHSYNSKEEISEVLELLATFV